MRLAQDQVQAIKSVARRVLGDDARVILFGSRTDDRQRGGDIDLLFETPPLVGNRAAGAFGHSARLTAPPQRPAFAFKPVPEPQNW